MREEALGGAASYKPAGPAITVSTPAGKAVTSFLSSARQQESTAEKRYNQDKANEQITQNQMNTLYAYMGSHGVRTSMLSYTNTLQHAYTQQQHQTSSDHHAVLAARAKVAAGNVVGYGLQAQSDLQTATQSHSRAATSYQQVTKVLPKGISLKPGGQPLTQAQIDGLNPAQQHAYFAYLNDNAVAVNDRAKVRADNAAINKNYAQLQLYASAPKNYGTIATDAVGAVNTAIAPQHLPMAAPAAIDVGKAKANLGAASQSAATANAYLNYTNAAIPALKASSHVAAAQANVDAVNKEINAIRACLPNNSPLMTHLGAAKDALANAQAAAALPQAAAVAAYAYLGKVQADGGVTQADAAVQDAQGKLGAAQAAYSNWRTAHPGLDAPGNKYETAVTKAEGQLAQAQQQASQARQQASLAGSQFNASYAALYAAQQQANAAANPAGKETAIVATEVARQMGDSAQKQALDYYVSEDKTAVQTDQQTVNGQQTAYNDWNATHPTDRNVALLAQANGVNVSDLNPNGKSLAQAQAKLFADQQTLLNNQRLAGAAQSQVNYDNFILSLPANLQDPQTAKDKAALQTAVSNYVFQATPINGQSAISQVKQDITNYQKNYLSTRGLVESGLDALGNFLGVNSGTHSAALSYMDNVLSNVQGIQSEMSAGKLTAQQYQTDLHGAMQNFNQTLLRDEATDKAGDQGWNTVDEVVRDAAATGLSMWLGPEAGFAFYQVWDGAENAKTALEGGSVMNDAHISLLTAGVDGIKSLAGDKAGGSTTGMWARAGIDAGVDAVTAATAAAAPGVGQIVTRFAGGMLGVAGTGTVDAALETTTAGAAGTVETTATAGTAAAGSAATTATATTATAGAAGTAAAAGGTGADAAASAATNPAWYAKPLAAAAGNMGSQMVMSAGQVASAALPAWNKDTGQWDGGVFTLNGGLHYNGLGSLGNAALQQLYYVGTAPFIGAASGALPASLESNVLAHVAVQGATDFAANSALTFGSNAIFQGRGMTGVDWFSSLANTVPGTMHLVLTHPDVAMASSGTSGTPGPFRRAGQWAMGKVGDVRLGMTGRLRLPQIPGVMSGPTEASAGRTLGTKTGSKVQKSDRFWEFRNAPLSVLTGYSSQEIFQFKAGTFQDAIDSALSGTADQSPFMTKVFSSKTVGTYHADTTKTVAELSLGFELKTDDAQLQPGKTDFFGARGPVREITHGIPFSKVMSETKYSLPLWLRAGVLHKLGLPPDALIFANLRPDAEHRPESSINGIPAGANVSDQFVAQVQATLAQVRLRLQVVTDDPAALHAALQPGASLDSIRGLYNMDPHPVTLVDASWRSGTRLSRVSTAPDRIPVIDLATGQQRNTMNPSQMNADVVFNKRTSPDRWLDSGLLWPAKRAIGSTPFGRRLSEIPVGRRLLPQPHYQPGKDFYPTVRDANSPPERRYTFAVTPFSSPLGIAQADVRLLTKRGGQPDTLPRILRTKNANENVPFNIPRPGGSAAHVEIPAWLAHLVTVGETGRGVAWPKGATAQVDAMLRRWQTDLPKSGLTMRNRARFRQIQNFRTGVLPNLPEGNYLAPQQVDQIIRFLSTQG